MPMELFTSFDPIHSPAFYFPRARTARLHEDVEWLLSASNAEMVSSFARRHPLVDAAALLRLLSEPCKEFRLSGTDVFPVQHASTGERRMMVLETNSCPSGQSSMPVLRSASAPSNMYVEAIRSVMAPMVERVPAHTGVLAVLYDKNLVEARAYATAMAHVFHEAVLLVPFHLDGLGRLYRWTDRHQLQVCVPGQQPAEASWLPVRAAFRYVTQKPHNRFPVVSNADASSGATLVLNPVVACLGRRPQQGHGARRRTPR